MMKKIFVLMVAIFAMALTASAQIAEGTYMISHADYPAHVLTTKNANPGNREAVVLTKWARKDNQLWQIKKNADGTYAILSLANPAYGINVCEALMQNGAEIITWNWTGYANENWKIEKQSNGAYLIMVAQDKNFCIRPKNGKVSDNVPLELTKAKSDRKMEWNIIKAGRQK